VDDGLVHGLYVPVSIGGDALDVHLHNCQIYVPGLAGCKQIVGNSGTRFTISGTTNITAAGITANGATVKFISKTGQLIGQ
jgi:hypothetical protein